VVWNEARLSHESKIKTFFILFFSFSPCIKLATHFTDDPFFYFSCLDYSPPPVICQQTIQLSLIINLSCKSTWTMTPSLCMVHSRSLPAVFCVDTFVWTLKKRPSSSLSLYAWLAKSRLPGPNVSKTIACNVSDQQGPYTQNVLTHHPLCSYHVIFTSEVS